MDADYGAPRELSPLQKARALYRPETPPCLQVPCASFFSCDGSTVSLICRVIVYFIR
jgi:diphosphate-dependent phosphofructokinase